MTHLSVAVREALGGSKIECPDGGLSGSRTLGRKHRVAMDGDTSEGIAEDPRNGTWWSPSHYSRGVCGRTRCEVQDPIPCSRPAALRRLGVATILKTHADDSIWEDISNDELVVSASDHLDEEVAREEQEEAESEMDGAVWFIACLSRVDGLVLMNPDLSVEGFGTIVTVETELELVFAAQDEFADPTRRVPLSPDDFGTRHRSMMRYCISYPGSVGFVISQDGDVRAMTTIANDLVVWDGVRLTQGPFGAR